MIELLGYTGMIFILLSIYANKAINFRVCGMIGCILMLSQAVLITSLSLVILNCVMFAIHLVKLIDILGEKNVDKAKRIC